MSRQRAVNPVLDAEKLYGITGTSQINPAGLPYPGGIFGQPPLPLGRRGIFEMRVPLERKLYWVDEGYADPYTGAPMPSTAMLEGLGAPEGDTEVELTLIELLAAQHREREFWAWVRTIGLAGFLLWLYKYGS